jgi:DNA-binding transcriptional LysR family regulator
MDIQLLETFLVVCEERNLSRAAARLFRTQPAITRQIQTLEEQLGVRLLERNSRGVRPTAQGEELRERCARILSDLHGLKEIGSEAEGPGGELVIACSDTVACHFLAPLLGRFAKECPRVQLRIESGVTPGIVNLVERGSCELGFVLLPLRNPRLDLMPVLRYRHVAVFSKGQAPLESETTVRSLCEMPLVLLTRDSATRRSFDEAVSAKGLQPHRILEVGSVSVQKAMIRAGMGAGILPDYALESSDDLDRWPIQGSHEKTLALCRLRSKNPSRPAKALIRLLEERAS